MLIDSQRFDRNAELPSRFGAAELPSIETIDLTEEPPERGRWLAPRLARELAARLERGEQSLLFLNRRGYAPLTLCRNCGFRFECPNCTARLELVLDVAQGYGHAPDVTVPCPACAVQMTIATVERLVSVRLRNEDSASRGLPEDSRPP